MPSFSLHSPEFAGFQITNACNNDGLNEALSKWQLPSIRLWLFALNANEVELIKRNSEMIILHETHSTVTTTELKARFEFHRRLKGMGSSTVHLLKTPKLSWLPHPGERSPPWVYPSAADVVDKNNEYENVSALRIVHFCGVLWNEGQFKKKIELNRATFSHILIKGSWARRCGSWNRIICLEDSCLGSTAYIKRCWRTIHWRDTAQWLSYHSLVIWQNKVYREKCCVGCPSAILDCKFHERLICTRLSVQGLGLWFKAHDERFCSKAVYAART